MSAWYLYLIRTQRGDLYTGITTDVARRLQEHQGDLKKGAKFLRGKGPLTLVFSQAVGTRSSALRAERAVKACSKARKEALVQGRLGLDTLIARDSKAGAD